MDEDKGKSTRGGVFRSKWHLLFLGFFLPFLGFIVFFPNYRVEMNGSPEVFEKLQDPPVQVELLEQCHIYGISDDSDKELGYYNVRCGYRVAGPEILSEEEAEKGTIFQITGVLESAFPFDRMIYLLRRIDGNGLGERVYHADVRGSVDDENYGLDHRYFLAYRADAVQRQTTVVDQPSPEPLTNP